jgi:hypothetical protein
MSLGLLMALPGSSSAQELFMLSTKSGLELYQVEKLIMPTFLNSQYKLGSGEHVTTGEFSHTPHRSTYGALGGKLLVVQSGLQTTPNGRLTLTGRIDWQPSLDGNAHDKNFVASLIKEKIPGQLGKE